MDQQCKKATEKCAWQLHNANLSGAAANKKEVKYKHQVQMHFPRTTQLLLERGGYIM